LNWRVTQESNTNFFKKKLYGACNSRANLRGRLQHWGGLCDFLWALMMIFLGVVEIILTGTSFQWDTWWQRSFGMALVTYSSSFSFLFLSFFSHPLSFHVWFLLFFPPEMKRGCIFLCYFHPKHLRVSQPKQFIKA
jgi:hypothetical protein